MNLVNPSNIEILQLTRQQAGLVGMIIADSFRHDPFNEWVFNNQLTMKLVFHYLAKTKYLKAGFGHIIGTGAATLWTPPDYCEEPSLQRDLSVGLRILFGAGPRSLLRAKAASETLAALRPKFPHYYLFAIAVLPKYQGQGLGKKLLLPVIQEADQKGAPIYLESSNPNNHAFYRSLGFETTQIIKVQENSPPIELMLRNSVSD